MWQEFIMIQSVAGIMVLPVCGGIQTYLKGKSCTVKNGFISKDIKIFVSANSKCFICSNSDLDLTGKCKRNKYNCIISNYNVVFEPINFRDNVESLNDINSFLHCN